MAVTRDWETAATARRGGSKRRSRVFRRVRVWMGVRVAKQKRASELAVVQRGIAAGLLRKQMPAGYLRHRQVASEILSASERAVVRVGASWQVSQLSCPDSTCRPGSRARKRGYLPSIPCSRRVRLTGGVCGYSPIRPALGVEQSYYVALDETARLGHMVRGTADSRGLGLLI